MTQSNLPQYKNFDPSLWHVAWAGDEIAGVSACRSRGGIGWEGTPGARQTPQNLRFITGDI